jgi:hypothetical protein
VELDLTERRHRTIRAASSSYVYWDCRPAGYLKASLVGRETSGKPKNTSMKNSFTPIVCLFLLLAVSARADELPFFSALRGEIVSQLTLASNTPPVNKKLVAALNTNLKLIDRAKPTLVHGSTALGTLAKNLGKTALSNTFLPILSDARTAYADAMDAEAAALES